MQSLSIINGFARSESLFAKNNRARTITISFLAGFTAPGMITELDYRGYWIREFVAPEPIKLKDDPSPQIAPFPFTFEEQQAMFLSALREGVTEKRHALARHLPEMGMTPENVVYEEHAGLIADRYGFLGVKITLGEITKGSAYDDTCLSEIEVVLHDAEGLWNEQAPAPDPYQPGMVLIPGGVFDMGSEDGERNELPVHRVTVSPFYLGRYEVTYAEYDAYCAEREADRPSDDGEGTRQPVRFVRWYDALNYCNWLSGKEGLKPVYSSSENTIVCDFSADGYRLPTEAEWEYAARGGASSEGCRYAGGQSPIPFAWFDINSKDTTHRVGLKRPNALGLYDMNGNVNEWCWDFYGNYGTGAEKDPRGPQSGRNRVVRGGNFRSYAADLRVSARAYAAPADRERLVGFRVARSSVPKGLVE